MVLASDSVADSQNATDRDHTFMNRGNMASFSEILNDVYDEETDSLRVVSSE